MVKYAKAKLDEPMELYEYQQVRYGMCIWLLQEKAGFSFEEARVYMADSRLESAEDLAKTLNVTKQTIHNLASSARAKMDKIEDHDEVFMGYTPLMVDYNHKVRNSGPLF